MISTGTMVIVEGVPDHLQDDEEMRTKELFLGCVGRKFEVVSITNVSGTNLLE